MRFKLVTLSETVKPGGDADVASDTVPEKPLMLDTVILDVLEDPVRSVRLAGLVEMLKLGPIVML